MAYPFGGDTAPRACFLICARGRPGTRRSADRTVGNISSQKPRGSLTAGFCERPQNSREETKLILLSLSDSGLCSLQRLSLDPEGFAPGPSLALVSVLALPGHFSGRGCGCAFTVTARCVSVDWTHRSCPAVARTAAHTPWPFSEGTVLETPPFSPPVKEPAMGALGNHRPSFPVYSFLNLHRHPEIRQSARQELTVVSPGKLKGRNQSYLEHLGWAGTERRLRGQGQGQGTCLVFRCGLQVEGWQEWVWPGRSGQTAFWEGLGAGPSEWLPAQAVGTGPGSPGERQGLGQKRPKAQLWPGRTSCGHLTKTELRGWRKVFARRERVEGSRAVGGAGLGSEA